MAVQTHNQQPQELQQKMRDDEISPAANANEGSGLTNRSEEVHLRVASSQPATDKDTTLTDELNSTAHGWVVIAAASTVLFVGVGYTNTFGVFQDHYQKTVFRNEPADKIIIIGSTAASLYFVLGILTGRFTDFAGYRVSLAIGTALMTGSMFAASFSKEYWQLFLSQGLMFGLGLSFVYPTATTVSTQYFRTHHHGLTNGIVVSGGALGGCILPYSTQRMIATCGLDQTFRILGYLAIALLVPSIVVIKPKQRRLETRSKHYPLLDFKLLSNGRFLSLAVACVIAMTGFLPRYFLIPTSAVAKGIDVGYASWLLGLMNGFSIIGRIGIGLVADRVGPLKALSASFVLCALGHFIFWLPGVTVTIDGTRAPTALFTLFVVYTGIFGSGFISLYPVVVAYLFGREALASKAGSLNTAIGISTLAGPSVVYAIVGVGRRKNWTIGVLTAGLFMFVGGLLLVMASSTVKKAKQGQRRDERR